VDGAEAPAEALRAYRRATSIAAKLVVVAMGGGPVRVADSDEAAMLDVAGLAPGAARVIGAFLAAPGERACLSDLGESARRRRGRSAAGARANAARGRTCDSFDSLGA